MRAGEIVVSTATRAKKLAELLNAETRRPMTRGVLDAKEPDSLEMIQEILKTMLGAREPGSGGGRKVCFTVPAAPLGSEDSLTYHEATLRQILSGLGYEPSSVNEGLAVIYAELVLRTTPASASAAAADCAMCASPTFRRCPC